MTLGGRIHAVAAAFAIGYLFVGSVVVRTDGVLVPSAAKVVFAVLGAWIVWAGTEGRKGSGSCDMVAPRSEDAVGTVLRTESGDLAAPRGEGAAGTVQRTRPVWDSPDRLKRLSELAFANGWTVEAAYWLALAQLRGATDRAERMRDYVEAWLAMGCPDELENVHAGFSEEQGSFGRSVLRFHSGSGLALAIARFSQMVHDGDENARAFLEENGIELPRKGTI